MSTSLSSNQDSYDGDPQLNNFSFNSTKIQSRYQEPPKEPPIADFIRFLDFYGTPSIIIVGIVGNVTSLICMRLMNERTSKSCLLCVAALTVAYTLHLLSLVDKWIGDIGHGIYGKIGGWCQFVTFLNHGCDFLCQWYAAGLAVDRCAFIAFRRRWAPVVCTAAWRRTFFSIFGAIAIVVYINISITSGEVNIGLGPDMPICMTLGVFRTTVLRLKAISVFVNNLLPLVIVFVSLTLIGWTVFSNERETVTNGGELNQRTAFLCDRKRSKVHSEKDEHVIGISTENVALSYPTGDTTTNTSITCGCHRSKSSGYAIALLAGYLLCNGPIHLYAAYDAFYNLIDEATNLHRYLILCALSALKHIGEASPFLCMLATSSSFKAALLALCRPLSASRSTASSDPERSLTANQKSNSAIELTDT